MGRKLMLAIGLSQRLPYNEPINRHPLFVHAAVREEPN